MFRDICEQFEVELIEFNGETDHLHMLIHYPPKVCLSHLVNSLKGVSSRMFAKEFGRIQIKQYDDDAEFDQLILKNPEETANSARKLKI